MTWYGRQLPVLPSIFFWELLLDGAANHERPNELANGVMRLEFLDLKVSSPWIPYSKAGICTPYFWRSWGKTSGVWWTWVVHSAGRLFSGHFYAHVTQASGVKWISSENNLMFLILSIFITHQILVSEFILFTLHLRWKLFQTSNERWNTVFIISALPW